jgi:hypothetical protein
MWKYLFFKSEGIL